MLEGMTDQLWPLIQEQIKGLSDNQFFQGGFLLGVLGAAAVYAKRLPGLIYNFLLKYGTITIEFDKEDVLFQWFVRWVGDQDFIRKKTRLRLTTRRYWEGEKRIATLAYSFARGETYVVKSPNGVWMLLSRQKEETQGDKDKSENYLMAGMLDKEKFHIRIPLWQRKRFAELVSEIYREHTEEREDEIEIYTAHATDGWRYLRSQSKRPLSSIILPRGLKDEIVDDINGFSKDEDWYIETGIPYQRGYLLEGPPGTGKTSLIYALACHLRYNLYTLNLSAVTSDTHLQSLLCTIPERSFVVIEDIDGFIRGRGKVGKGFATFSGLLNAINGIADAHGRIMFLTTNHIEELDPALLREGRIDKRFSITYCDNYQLKHLFLKFFPNETEMASLFVKHCAGRSLSPAQIQNHLMSFRDDIQKAVNGASNLECKKKEYEKSKKQPINKEKELEKLEEIIEDKVTEQVLGMTIE